jgi:hypothetical protein
MPYHIEKEGSSYRIRTPHGLLRGHYESRQSAQRVVRYLYASEGRRRPLRPTGHRPPPKPKRR